MKTNYKKSNSLVYPTFIRELQVSYKRKKIQGKFLEDYAQTADLVYEFFKELGYQTRENVICLHLNNQLKILSYELVGMGDNNHAICDVPGIFRGAILAMASSIILVHNHPNGVCKASSADIDVFRKISQLGKLHKIPLNDFIIIDENGYCSFIQEYPDLMTG